MGRSDRYAPADRVPAAAAHHLRRSAVLEALDVGATRRVLRVCAGPGFGKTTELAAWTRLHSAAWYTVDARDGDAHRFAAGLAGAVRRRVDRAERPTWPGPLGPQGGDELRVEAAAATLAEWLEESLDRELTLVIDDCDQLPAGSTGAALLAALGRRAPAGLHLILAGRSLPPLPGHLDVGELNASRLTFSRDETARLLTAILGSEAVGLASAAYDLTGGWPAAVRMLAEALDRVPVEARAARLASMRRPGEALVQYVIEEVIATSEPDVAELLRLTSALPGFTASVCADGGLATDEARLQRLARQGLLRRRSSPVGPVFEVPRLIAEAVQSCLPPPDPDRDRRLRNAAVDWLVRHGQPAAALATVRELGDAALAAHLTRWGDALLAGGEVAAVVAAVDALPEEHRTPHLWRLAGQARQVRGDWPGALAYLHRAADLHAAAGDAERLPPALVWRLGLIYYFRGELDEALRVFLRGDATAGPDAARLLSWVAATYWLRQDHDNCRDAALRALALATESGDDAALAEAHATRAMLAAMDGDQTVNVLHYDLAKRFAERAGDVLSLLRVRNNIGSRLLEEGDYRAAVVEFDDVIRLAERTGYASLLALASHNRGTAHSGLGRLHEAASDFEAALRTYQAIDSRMAAYPLTGLGDVLRLSGDLPRARACYERAIDVLRAGGDVQGMVPALAGLARVLVDDDPDRADALAAEALHRGQGISESEAHLAVGWIALHRGDAPAALRWAEQALAAAGPRQQRPRLAEAMELVALAAPDPRQELPRLTEAFELWQRMGHVVGQTTNAYLRACLSDEDTADAEQALRGLGIRVAAGRPAAGPLRFLVIAPAGARDQD